MTEFKKGDLAHWRKENEVLYPEHSGWIWHGTPPYLISFAARHGEGPFEVVSADKSPIDIKGTSQTLCLRTKTGDAHFHSCFFIREPKKETGSLGLLKETLG